MKLMHLSDLHLGKRLNECSLLEDQDYILRAVLALFDRERPDAVLLAGDIYDKAVPSAEAVELFHRFLCALCERRAEVFIISGNHDSPERIAFGAGLMDASGIHMSPLYDGSLAPLTLRDAFGPVRFWLLPFLKPVHVRRFFPEAEIASYTDALRCALSALPLDPGERNVLLTHQFVTGAERSESEELSLGGSDNVDAGVFDAFDYVALGHLHAPQSVGRETLRYCGSPLAYSFSEIRREKSVTLVELGAKGSVSLRCVPLRPLRAMRELRGTYLGLSARSSYEGTATDDYLHIILTDEEDVPDAAAKLRLIYPHLLKLDYDNTRTRESRALTAPEEQARRSPLALFDELYEKQNNRPMSEEQRRYAAALIGKVWEEDA